MQKLLHVAFCVAVVMVYAGCAPAHPSTSGANAAAVNSGGLVPPTTPPPAGKYNYVDPTDIIPAQLKSEALAYFDANLSKIPNQAYLTIVDFTLHSSLPRFYVIDMATGAVSPHHVAHGIGSDPNNTGYATQFSNTPNSDMSSLGFYLTGGTYDGVHGNSLRIDGLSTTDSNVRVRDIVVHGADYVYDSDTQAGRSDGCFALPMDVKDDIISQIKGGSIMFAALEK